MKSSVVALQDVWGAQGPPVFYVWCLNATHFLKVLPKWTTFFSTFVLPVSLAKVDGGTVTKCNFAGDEKAGASWTDKIMANKADGASTQKPGDGEGAEEDEWVRSPTISNPSLAYIQQLKGNTSG